jgi:two-component system response regulator FixJ
MHVNPASIKMMESAVGNLDSSSLPHLINIVEDDAAVRDSLALFLESQGFVVATFGSGRELFDAGSPQCSCLILDINLPGETGFELLERLRRNGQRAPAIFMSGRAGPEARARAIRASAAAFFDKPVPPQELLAAVKSATGHMP